MNDTIKNQGEQLTFFQIFSEKNWKIEIPIIQRDYAQGRKSASEIRVAFLNTLYSHLSTNKYIDLDFVYGSLSSSDSTLFIPLDGQQRLTTLFLLHWYLSIKEGEKKNFDSYFTDNKKSKFSYETRTSSSEFCNALICCNIDLTNLLPSDKNKKNCLSKTIRDSAWYFGSWDNDPTIQSMLTMLDSINDRFKTTDKFFNKLIDKNNPIITFQFLNLKEFKLTDDLYIKMNARGKQLTPFENFKAKFEQYIKELKFTNASIYKLIYEGKEYNVPVYEYFSYNIDTIWANLFWNYKSKKNIFDYELMNFIRVVATNHYALKEKNDDKLENLKLLIGKEDANRKDIESTPISFAQYYELGCFDEKFIIDLISIFDLVVNGDDKIKSYLSDKYYFDEEDVFSEVIKNRLNYTQQVRFFAFYQYLITNKTSAGLVEWMRVIFNLSENTIYNRVVEYSRSINAIALLLPNSSDILKYISDFNNPVVGFLDLQITEERIKSILIQKNDDWKNAIIEVEKHGYFSGQINFILNFSGIEDYYLKNNYALSWSDVEDKNFFKLFTNYVYKAKAIFSAPGLNSFSEYSFERALFSKGDYLLKEGSNFSFLIDNDRDISWKRLLRDNNGAKREYVKQIFDDPDFDIKNIQNSLEKIILKSSVTDWKKHFIELPENIDYLGFKKYIRWEEDGERIYLLKKERLSGSHAEYYTYSFFTEYLDNKTYLPFSKTWYYEVSGDEEQPCAVIDDWIYHNNQFEMDIYYSSDAMAFRLHFHDKKGGVLPNEVISILTTHGFSLDEMHYVVSVDRSDLITKIKDLCSEYGKL